ncbi:MAG: type II toxin-antitoxin system HicA family toxin [Chloroflexi bacterium]|nr:type II toxin-antitoxin system HicA family toxin [Chloroflexota bacterium]
MSALPSISGRECVKVLGKMGFQLKRQEGSHMILRRNDPFTQLVVPDHKELDRGTVRAIIRQAGISVDEFVKLL